MPVNEIWGNEYETGRGGRNNWVKCLKCQTKKFIRQDFPIKNRCFFCSDCIKSLGTKKEEGWTDEKTNIQYWVFEQEGKRCIKYSRKLVTQNQEKLAKRKEELTKEFKKLEQKTQELKEFISEREELDEQLKELEQLEQLEKEDRDQRLKEKKEKSEQEQIRNQDKIKKNSCLLEEILKDTYAGDNSTHIDGMSWIWKDSYLRDIKNPDNNLFPKLIEQGKDHVLLDIDAHTKSDCEEVVKFKDKNMTMITYCAHNDEEDSKGSWRFYGDRDWEVGINLENNTTYEWFLNAFSIGKKNNKKIIPKNKNYFITLKKNRNNFYLSLKGLYEMIDPHYIGKNIEDEKKEESNQEEQQEEEEEIITNNLSKDSNKTNREKYRYDDNSNFYSVNGGISTFLPDHPNSLKKKEELAKEIKYTPTKNKYRFDNKLDKWLIECFECKISFSYNLKYIKDNFSLSPFVCQNCKRKWEIENYSNENKKQIPVENKNEINNHQARKNAEQSSENPLIKSDTNQNSKSPIKTENQEQRTTRKQMTQKSSSTVDNNNRKDTLVLPKGINPLKWLLYIIGGIIIIIVLSIWLLLRKTATVPNGKPNKRSNKRIRRN